MVGGKRKAARGFLGVGARRRETATTVKLPGKLINRNPPPGSLDRDEKKKAADSRTKKRLFNLLIWGKIGGKLQKYPENERKMSKNL